MHALNFFVLVMSEVGHVTIVSSLLTINLTLKKKIWMQSSFLLFFLVVDVR